jgi:hypothetical protein
MRRNRYNIKSVRLHDGESVNRSNAAKTLMLFFVEHMAKGEILTIKRVE